MIENEYITIKISRIKTEKIGDKNGGRARRAPDAGIYGGIVGARFRASNRVVGLSADRAVREFLVIVTRESDVRAVHSGQNRVVIGAS